MDLEAAVVVPLPAPLVQPMPQHVHLVLLESSSMETIVTELAILLVPLAQEMPTHVHLVLQEGF